MFINRLQILHSARRYTSFNSSFHFVLFQHNIKIAEAKARRTESTMKRRKQILDNIVLKQKHMAQVKVMSLSQKYLQKTVHIGEVMYESAQEFEYLLLQAQVFEYLSKLKYLIR